MSIIYIISYHIRYTKHNSLLLTRKLEKKKVYKYDLLCGIVS